MSKSPEFLLFLPVSEAHYLHQPWLVQGEAMIGYAVFHAEDVPSCIARVVLKEVPISRRQKMQSWCFGIMALARFVVARIFNPHVRNTLFFSGKPRAIGIYFRVIHSCDPSVKEGVEFS